MERVSPPPEKMRTPDPDLRELHALFGNTPLSTPPSSLPATPSARERDTPSVEKESNRGRELKFWIDLPPRMSSVERAKYKSFASAIGGDEDEDPVEVVYDMQLQGRIFYYARMRTGLYKKFSKGFFIENEDRFGNLVEEYLDAKDSESLEPFDPSSRRVIPSDRMRPEEFQQLKNAKMSARSTRQSERESTSAAGTSELTEDDSKSESDDDEFDDMMVRKGTRTTSRNKLPFSPKRTRVVAARSSTRNKGAAVIYKYKSGEETDEDYDMLNSDDEYVDRPLSTKKGPKAPRIRRAARPEYGFVRSTDDLDDSDSEGNPLMAHRNTCEKCLRPPAHIIMVKVKRKGQKGKQKRKGRGSDADLQESDDEVTATGKLGGWLRCMKCPVTSHWKCLVGRQRDEVLTAIKERLGNGSKPSPLSYDETTEFICDACTRGGVCIQCDKPVDSDDPVGAAGSVGTQPPALAPPAPMPSVGSPKPSIAVLVTSTPGSHASSDVVDAALNAASESKEKHLLFRCITCKRPAHYEHLPPLSKDTSADVENVALSYQKTWQCPDCRRWEYELDKILAWRPYPANAVEPPREPDTAIKYNSPLPREYLVKWQRRSYRHLEWVPHQWLLNTNSSKLRHFLTKGTKIALHPIDHKDVVSELQKLGKAPLPPLAIIDQTSKPSSGRATPSASGLVDLGLPKRLSRTTDDKEDGEEDDKSTQELPEGEPEANLYAELCVPRQWKTVDRVLDVLFLIPSGKGKSKKGKVSQMKKKRQISSEEDELEADSEDDRNRATFVEGEEPDSYLVETTEERETRTGRKISGKDLKDAVWVFVKWQDLAYDDAAWDTPPGPNDPRYAAYTEAFRAFVEGLKVELITLKPAAQVAKDAREPQDFPVIERAAFRQGGTLLPFQLEGVTWLYRGWHNKQTGILGDEMGLGKTVQMITFLGMLVQEFIFPILVVVPNSTIANWMREFQRWAPHVRAVQYCGVAESRAVIRQYELYHKGSTNLKFHVLVATYESITNPKEFNMVFGRVKRWEALIVDEGQRLKSESSQIFRRLGELYTMHRIIMTGTPLQNNIRELFTLMNFLDPHNWADLKALEAEFEELDDEKLADLRGRLKPYFLRRIKSDVMDLPPKNEVIVPLSMVPLQKVVYKSLLENNLEIIGSLTTRAGQAKSRAKNLMNVLMQLRKCMQHPYLVDRDLEPKDLDPEALHQNVIDTSAKLHFLQMLLPKLKQRGHRVLLFSQFKINLDFIEDFLAGEGYKFLRLDGDMAQVQRQRDMDRFNEKDSDVFIYILSTRAGGVGINLWSADTVIVFDPDFNPHQDLQAIARAHRMGQTKKVIVFKLMIKNAAEEKIFQVGKVCWAQFLKGYNARL
ncbi:hypothetical protein FRB93_012245 [Tulasnella sp. JGI-2019a]|nr:hypothetical protein FRB93_012245 [Tulasnella sp. JGI-2019a]